MSARRFRLEARATYKLYNSYKHFISKGQGSTMTSNRRNEGFTIVELLVVIVVIAILAAITIVSYNGIALRAKETALKVDLKNGATQLQVMYETDGSYPADTSTIKKAATTTFTYSFTADAFCLQATSTGLPGKSFYIQNGDTIKEGTCPATLALQTVTTANCPTTRTLAVDARDNHTYWIQKLGDGKCWMMTNLGYAGGGTNTYGDVKTLQDGTADGTSSYTSPKYFVVASTTNFTLAPAEPSTSTNGTGQYGYLYNWCAAMGVQTATAACANAETPAPSTSISVCPANWRLPVGGSGGEFTALNTAINGGSTSTDTGLLNNWLAQKGGAWFSGYTHLNNAGSNGGYFTSMQASGFPSVVFGMSLTSSSVSTAVGLDKATGYAVRCVAAS